MDALYNFKLTFAAVAEKYAIEMAAEQAKCSKRQLMPRGWLSGYVDWCRRVDCARVGVGVCVIVKMTGAAMLPPSPANSFTAN